MGGCCSTGAIDADMVNIEPKQQHKQKVVICGGDHAAHIFTALAAKDPNNEVHLISLFYKTETKESETPSGESDHGTITVKVSPENKEIQSTPTSIFNDPKKNLVDADIVILSLPAFSHSKALTAIKKNIKPRANKKTLVAVFNAASGLEREWQSVFGADNNHFVLLSCTTLPWTCKTLTFRESAEILATKPQIHVCIKSTNDDDAALYNKLYIEQIAGIIGNSPKIKDYGHILNMSLSAMNAIVHPSIMYGKWKDYDGDKMDEKPLFYQGIDENTANIMSELSDEVIKITKCISKETGLALVTQPIYKWYKKCYGKECGDKSSLYKIMTTNKAYKGITHPMKQSDDGKFVPNWRYRYLSEDIPYGLVVIKGLSLILSPENKCDTPLMDKIIKWSQGVLNKEYLKYQDDGTVVAGNDIGLSRAPQKYKIKSIKEYV